jgi:hypothetical protein
MEPTAQMEPKVTKTMNFTRIPSLQTTKRAKKQEMPVKQRNSMLWSRLKGRKRPRRILSWQRV